MKIGYRLQSKLYVVYKICSANVITLCKNIVLGYFLL